MSILKPPKNVNSFYILKNGLMGGKGKLDFTHLAPEEFFANFRITFVKNRPVCSVPGPK